ncbi:MAG: Omp28-related outer membrane protein [Saprospiraceae bacterium]|nr:Omp28-related outer membrane protein [Saprospiraceae bacterium]
MKNLSLKNLFSLSLIVLLAASCQENMPVIPDLTTISSNKKVIIEEFTGVACVNCPAGSAEIESLLAQFPNNLIAVSIHTGNFARPYTSSKYDFRTEDGDRITGDFFGEEPFSYPSAIIDRKKLGQGTHYVGQTSWAGHIVSEFAEGSPVSLALRKSYDSNSHTLDLEVDILPLEDLPSDCRISILLTETGISDYQLLPSPTGWKSDYTHKHVLRDIITNFDGDIITEPLTSGITVTKSFEYQLDEDWDAAKCEVIALVHRFTSDTKEVLQAEKEHVAD